MIRATCRTVLVTDKVNVRCLNDNPPYYAQSFRSNSDIGQQKTLNNVQCLHGHDN